MSRAARRRRRRLLDVDLDGRGRAARPDAPVPVARRRGGAARGPVAPRSPRLHGRRATGARSCWSTALGRRRGRRAPALACSTAAWRLRPARHRRADAGEAAGPGRRTVPAAARQRRPDRDARSDRTRRGRRSSADAGAVLVADYGRGVTAGSRTCAAPGRAPHRVPVVWDPHPRGDRPGRRACRLVTPNRAEAARSLPPWRRGGRPRPVRRARRPCARTPRRCVRHGGVRRPSRSRSASGGALLSLRRGRRRSSCRRPPVPCADPCGAGDRFAASAALGARRRARSRRRRCSRPWPTPRRTSQRGGPARCSPRRPPRPALTRPSGASGWSAAVAGPGRHRGRHRRLLRPAARRPRRDAARGARARRLPGRVPQLRRLRAPAEGPAHGRSSPRRTGPGCWRRWSCVDAVVVFDEDTPVEVLRRLRPARLGQGRRLRRVRRAGGGGAPRAGAGRRSRCPTSTAVRPRAWSATASAATAPTRRIRRAAGGRDDRRRADERPENPGRGCWSPAAPPGSAPPWSRRSRTPAGTRSSSTGWRPRRDVDHELVDLARTRARPRRPSARRRRRVGGLDAVVTCAGTDACGRLEDVPADDWDRVVAGEPARHRGRRPGRAAGPARATGRGS